MDAVESEAGLGAGGALEAGVEAREEGLVRVIGVTGHGLSAPAVHARSLERFPCASRPTSSSPPAGCSGGPMPSS